ncbi:MAG: histidine phosphatase family protein [Pseudomonadota bacterium]
MHLLLVRHGQTRFNAEHRYLGALDPELNAMGILQATALRAVLPDNLDAVVCSPLRRARQTADTICQDSGLLPSVNTAFRERHVGVFEGLTQMEAQTRFPDLWGQNVTRQWHAAPTGGETIAEVVERVTAGLRGLSEQHRGKTVALVAHGFVAKVIRAVAQAGFDDFFEWQLANGAVHAISLPATDAAWLAKALPPLPQA